jgi:hypothetical protein
MRRTIDASDWDFAGLAGSVTTFLDPGADPGHAGSFLDQVPSSRAAPIISTSPEIEDTANGLLEEAYGGGDRGGWRSR